MSIDINWPLLTTGPDGAAFAETVRAFIHERFQHVTLPRFIRSVQVHSFDFGSVPPELEVKDVCDPLPDFYEDDDDDDDEDDEDEGDESGNVEVAAAGHHNVVTTAEYASPNPTSHHAHQRGEPSIPTASMRPPYGPASIDPRSGAHARMANPPRLDTTQQQSSYYPQGFSPVRPNSPESLSRRSSTPGIPGGTSNLSSFHLPLSAGISGASTPLAAFGGHRFGGAQADHHAFLAKQNGDRFNPLNSTNGGASSTRPTRPPLRQPSTLHNTTTTTTTTGDSPPPASNPSTPSGNENTPAPSDVQVVLRATYTGDIRIVLTADILLDYPMTSFVGIPLKLTVTGLQFDGVAILAHIRQKACFCFLSPDDADALVGMDNAREPAEGGGDLSPTATGTSGMAPGQGDDNETRASRVGSLSSGGGEEGRRRVGNLLEEIRIESEIGEKKEGKQVLKNVGKVEKFVLEQVRRIFEQEFVYPSFWTFLV